MDISVADFILFCKRTIGEMRTAIDRCDDVTVNALPSIPAPNSPYQLIHHSLSACAWWTSHIICGHPSARDRDREFTSSGTVADLHAQADDVIGLLQRLQPELEAATELAGKARTALPIAEAWTVGKAMIHAYEELAQHLGHLEITVDLVTSETKPSAISG